MKFPSLIFLYLLGFYGYSQNNSTTFLVTNNSVGPFKIGMTEIEAFKTIQKGNLNAYLFNTSNNIETDMPAPTFSVCSGVNDFKEYYFDIFTNKNVIDKFEIDSKKFKTKNGIHVGMTIKDLSKLTKTKLVLSYTGEVTMLECFVVKEYPNIWFIVEPNIKREIVTLLRPNAEYDTPNNFSFEGKIIGIWLFSSN